MQIIKDIKFERLFLALGITLLIADTVPHPHLSAGFVEHSPYWVQAELRQESSPEGVVTRVDR
ncbi:MAG: hypothetical protein F6K00_29355 [Leptolyngbya sp. SIOISBB]|nr:hypothetical protein [Leptolyngbya sp. SIOISBB]